jgi:precorrin-2/cobalt-factor-2 C20-methyltransferase
MSPQPELAQAAYDEGASRISAELEQGHDVAVLCEGDPLFYGSFAQLFARLGEQYRTDIVPGVISITAAAAAARLPLVWRTRTLMAVPATLPKEALVLRLQAADAIAVLKVGRHLSKLRAVLTELGMLDRAIYVERASTDRERVMPLIDYEGEETPYFALVLLPARTGT